MAVPAPLRALRPRNDSGDLHLRAAPQMREYEAAVDRIVRSGPGRVLDWGCGFGQLSSLLRARGADVTSFEWDGSAPAVEVRALERYRGLQATFSAEPVALPFADASFDTVLSMGVLEHVQDPDGSLDELHRVLAPGGALYVYKLPNRFSYLEWLARRGGLPYHGMNEHDRLYTVATARALVERHGFRVEEVRLANMLPLGLASPAARRAAGAIWAANRLVSDVPGLNRVATNVELVARRGQ